MAGGEGFVSAVARNFAFLRDVKAIPSLWKSSDDLKLDLGMLRCQKCVKVPFPIIGAGELRFYRMLDEIFLREINEQKSPSQDAEESNEPIIRIRGMPWSATEKDVVKFFGDITVRGGTEGVNMVLSREGRASGEAYLELENLDDMERALKKNNQNMGHRYIELFRATRSEMEWVLKRQYGGPESPQDGCVRLRGLPFGCTKEEVANFFTGLEIVPNGINLVADFSGRSTGEAYVQFANDESAEKALEKHKEKIGHRYIEIFRSSLSEMKSAMVSPKMRGSGSNRPAPYDSSNRFGGANRFGGGGGRGGRMSGGSGGGGGGMRGKRGNSNFY
ncbi:unnamed protein product [Notodromas monacha]|uniref:RRM domain-containing protein n=1 Tax=Notodromas monacha TaxID=399045 RepID=A0A7R9GAI8_9CRUS|nr:unnamed protein product [Notodromas monacha]CAG0914119.1 unnamed protein product [Notodromas monacha]